MTYKRAICHITSGRCHCLKCHTSSPPITFPHTLWREHMFKGSFRKFVYNILKRMHILTSTYSNNQTQSHSCATKERWSLFERHTSCTWDHSPPIITQWSVTPIRPYQLSLLPSSFNMPDLANPSKVCPKASGSTMPQYQPPPTPPQLTGEINSPVASTATPEANASSWPVTR